MRKVHQRVSMVLVVLGLLAFASTAHAQTLMWDASTSTDVTGYRVWSGQISGVYNSQTDVGKVTSYKPVGLDWTKHQFFVVQAYNAAGMASAYSAQVEWVPSVTTLTSLTSNGGASLLMGQPVTWTTIGSNNLGPIEFEYWLYGRNGWTIVQPWGASNTFTWTPGWDDQGTHFVQVWARAVGSSATYEAALGTNAFTVASEPMTLAADTDFPTPPSNPVTLTATVSGAGTTQLEYKFWVLNPSTGWTTFRDWSSSNQATWTPTATGTYSVQAWTRRVGNTANYDQWAGIDNIVVSRTAPLITTFNADRPFPSRTGTPIKWTVRSRGGTAGPVQYQFWLYSTQTGWTLAQPYSSSRTFTWTPTWSDAGSHAVQVWVKSQGVNSTPDYEDWRSSSFFNIERAPVHLTTNTLFPLAPGTTVQWTAALEDPNVTLEYQFWVYKLSTAAWTISQAYGPSNTFAWTPTAGTYALQVWARQPGSTSNYDVYEGTSLLTVAASPATVISLTANKTFPAASGSAITWTAGATGGTGPLQYQFWRFDSATGWTVVQAWSTSKTYTWTPAAGDAGSHVLQVWVKSPGSTANYDSYMATGYFVIQP